MMKNVQNNSEISELITVCGVRLTGTWTGMTVVVNAYELGAHQLWGFLKKSHFNHGKNHASYPKRLA